MKKIILSAIFFLGLAVTGFSQEKHEMTQKTPEERAQKMTDMLDKKLSLSGDQKSQIYQINLERAQAMNSFRGDKSDKSLDKAQIKAKFQASEDKILAVLNDNQKATYNQLKAEREAKFKEHQGRRKGKSGK